jgi:hypothetical protein
MLNFTGLLGCDVKYACMSLSGHGSIGFSFKHYLSIAFIQSGNVLHLQQYFEVRCVFTINWA